MNEKQKKSTAKYLYDVSKGIALLAIIGNLLKEKWDIPAMFFGSIAAILTFTGAFLLVTIMSDMAVFFMILSIIALAGVIWIYYTQRKHKHG